MQRTNDFLSEQRWDRVTELRLRRGTTTDDFELVRIREQPLYLGHAQAPVIPMERTDIRARLRLDSG